MEHVYQMGNQLYKRQTMNNKITAREMREVKNKVEATRLELERVEGEVSGINELKAKLVETQEKVLEAKLRLRALKLETLRMALLASGVLGENEFFSNLNELMNTDNRVIQMIVNHSAKRSKIDQFNENSRWLFNSGRLGW